MNDDSKIEIADVISIRLIRSFEYRNVRNILIKNVDLNMKVEDFEMQVLEKIKHDTTLIPTIRYYVYDTLKIEHHMFESKSNNAIINMENDEELILKKNKTLKFYKIRNETEISYFNMEDYLNYKKNPQSKW